MVVWRGAAGPQRGGAGGKGRGGRDAAGVWGPVGSGGSQLAERPAFPFRRASLAPPARATPALPPVRTLPNRRGASPPPPARVPRPKYHRFRMQCTPTPLSPHPFLPQACITTRRASRPIHASPIHTLCARDTPPSLPHQSPQPRPASPPARATSALRCSTSPSRWAGRAAWRAQPAR